jgi:hypothetical protein
MTLTCSHCGVKETAADLLVQLFEPGLGREAVFKALDDELGGLSVHVVNDRRSYAVPPALSPWTAGIG